MGRITREKVKKLSDERAREKRFGSDNWRERIDVNETRRYLNKQRGKTNKKREMYDRSERDRIDRWSKGETEREEAEGDIGEKKRILKQREGGLTVELININNLDIKKMGELENLFFREGDEYRILYLTETHHG